MPDVKKQKPQHRKKPGAQDPQRDEAGRFQPGNSVAAKWTEDKSCEIGQQLIDWMNEAQQNFWIKDFLLEHGLYADVIRYLSEKYPRFCDYIARAKEIEATRIQKFAMMNQLNTGMAQWVLSVHHGLHNIQKSETELKNSQPVVIHIDERIAKE